MENEHITPEHRQQTDEEIDAQMKDLMQSDPFLKAMHGKIADAEKGGTLDTPDAHESEKSDNAQSFDPDSEIGRLDAAFHEGEE